MTNPQLGRLEKVDLREAWATEVGDFTPWLADQQNIVVLGDTIGTDLKVEAQEKDVGPFRADILCKDRVNGDWVLIENQLESTDHTHLGQCMTYAAGLSAVKIVWIARTFTDEHRAALDWLNEITDSRFNFFGREVELWRIQDSPVAPRFNVVCKPNDWSRNVADAARSIESGQSSETEQQYLKFWTQFAERVDARGNPIPAPKPYGGYLRSFSVGKAYFYIFALAPMRDKWIGMPTAGPRIPDRASAHGSNDFRSSIIRGNGPRRPCPGLLSAPCSPLGNETANDESELTGTVPSTGKQKCHCLAGDRSHNRGWADQIGRASREVSQTSPIPTYLGVGLFKRTPILAGHIAVNFRMKRTYLFKRVLKSKGGGSLRGI